MLHRLLFIQGKTHCLVFKIHFILSLAIWQLYLNFIPNLLILIYRKREQVNYLNNLHLTLLECD